MGQRSEKLLHEAVASPPLALLFIELPPLAQNAAVMRLSLSASAAANMLAVVASGEPTSADFAAIVGSDPALAVWCLLRAGDDRLRTVAALGQWLADRWPEVLVWSRCEEPAAATNRLKTAGYTQSYARSIAWAQLIADLAGQLARHAGKAALADEASLAGLVAAEALWACSPSECNSGEDELLPILPQWLVRITFGNVGKPARNSAAYFAEHAQAMLLHHPEIGNMRRQPDVPPTLRDIKIPKGFSFDSAEWKSRHSALVETFQTPLPGVDRFASAMQRLAHLARLEADFDRRLEHAKIESLKELAYGAGHEINNPLANISARAQTLIKEDADPERRRKLASIHTQALRAHEMIADMMFFARPPQPVLAEVDLVAFIVEMLPAIQNLAAAQQTAVVWLPAAEPIVVRADRAQIAVAVRALCTNALEALQTGGEIHIELKKGDKPLFQAGAAADSSQCVQLAVVDNGPGIAPDVRRHLFDPFYSGREAGRGLGFGLCKCWRIAERHGGRIDVESAPGRTRFVITLPV